MLSELRNFYQKYNSTQNTEVNAFHLFIVGAKLREGTSTVYEDCNPEEMIIDETVQKWLLQSTQYALTNIMNHEIININDVDEAGESIKRYIEINELSQLNQWKEVIKNETFENNAPGLINSNDFKPKALIVSFQIEDKSIYFLKVISESVLLKTRKILGLNTGRGAYELKESQNRNLFLDDQWDAVIFNSNVIMHNEGKILTLFKYYEKFREAAEQVVSQIGDLGLLSEGVDLMSFIGSQISLQKKLARATDYPFDSIQKERIENLINSGTIKLSLNEDGKIECTTKEEARVVIDVILDNYVTSMITDENYRALNKSRLYS